MLLWVPVYLQNNENLWPFTSKIVDYKFHKEPEKKRWEYVTKIQDMFQILTPHSADKFNYVPLYAWKSDTLAFSLKPE